MYPMLDELVEGPTRQERGPDIFSFTKHKLLLERVRGIVHLYACWLIVHTLRVAVHDAFNVQANKYMYSADLNMFSPCYLHNQH